MIALEQFSQLTHAHYTQAHDTLIITGTYADAASRISQLTAEMLAARDDDDDDPFLSSDDDEGELETNELIVDDTD